MTDLLDLLRAEEHAGDPRHDWVHLTLPSMGYVCGGNIADGLPDGGPRGLNRLGGAGTEDGWEAITCPDCRAPGRREVARITHRQQKPITHGCADPAVCSWLTISEET